MKCILTIGLVWIFISCSQNSNNSNTIEESESIMQSKLKYDSISTKNDVESVISKSDLEIFLTDSSTPKMAVELYNNTYVLKDDEVLDILENLESKDVLKRWFYFRVITNSYKIADSSYSEGLGYAGKEYIENNTCEFASYFDNKECFSEKDLETWVDIAMLEFRIIGETVDGRYDQDIVINFNKTLIESCENAPSSQKETIAKFCKSLEKKYFEFINQ